MTQDSTASLTRWARSLLVLAVASGVSRGQTTTLQNTFATYVFDDDGLIQQPWLANATLPGSVGTLTFAKDPMWQVELRLEGLSSTAIIVDPTTLAPDPPNPFVSKPVATATVVTYRWQGQIFDHLQPASILTVDCTWVLLPAKSYLQTGITVTVTNPPGGRKYTVFRVHYPRLKVQGLDPSATQTSGNDRLAIGSYGGMLFEDPILYRDSYSGNQFSYQAPVGGGFEGATINATDPGIWAIPLAYYYLDSATPYGLYIANTDDKGCPKEQILVPDDSSGPPGYLNYELRQFANNANVFTNTSFTSSYRVHVGIMAGDWVDAAKQYRRFRIDPSDSENRFAWLDGSGGAVQYPVANSTELPAWLKSDVAQGASPFQGRISVFDGYCVGNPANDFDGPPPGGEAQAELDFLTNEFCPNPAVRFPFLQLDRFLVNYDEVWADSGAGGRYRPSTGSCLQAAVHGFLDHAQALGHHVILDSMTEKYWHPDDDDSTWDDPQPQCDWCGNPLIFRCATDPALRQLAWDNTLVYRTEACSGSTCTPCALGANPCWPDIIRAEPCPAGLNFPLVNVPSMCPTTPPMPTYDAGLLSFGQWFSDFVAEVLVEEGIGGGVRFNTPSANAGYCLAADAAHLPIHDHEPSVGDFYCQAWMDLIRDVRTKAGNPLLPVVIETSNSTVAEEVRVQNPWSTDFSYAPGMTVDEVHDATWDDYFNAPVCKVPMLQMVADEIRYFTQYGIAPLRLTATGNAEDGGGPIPLEVGGPLYSTDYFQDFPSVVGSILCWQMANRALIHQAGIALSNLGLDRALAQTTPPTSDQGFALRGMINFYKGLGTFLTKTVGSHQNMQYYLGTMERAPVLNDVAGEHFTIPASHFPELETLLNAFSLYDLDADGTNNPDYPVKNIDYSKYRPYDGPIFERAAVRLLKPIAPEEHPSWLPHGMYRAPSGKLALFVANPWGAKHIASASPLVLRPMNPFTFDYANPLSSPTTNQYTFKFDFEPGRYAVTGPVSITEYHFDKDGVQRYFHDHGTVTGNTQITAGALSEFRYAVFYFD